ncbi:MAG: TonB-dependent receptor [Sphingomonas bacterium]
MANSNRLRRVLEAGVSIAALCVITLPAVAQTATATAPDNVGQSSSQEAAAGTDPKPAEKDIIVTGVRAALQSARQRKKDADTLIESISATDIGAFPDKSVAEALQRVPGITVQRFAVNTDTAHFSAEPSGVIIRGLPQVRNEFNGRDTFSANSSRGLSWGDVPAELLGGVDIYKNQTADLIEGGIAGSVNLRTRVPFDSKGQVFQLGVKANYGDIVQKVSPDLSAFYSNRWQTDLGEFGLMGHVAYSHVKTASLGLQSYRAGIFTGGMIPGSANVTSDNFAKGTVVIPTGLNLLNDQYDRKRLGIAAAGQWKSNDGKWLATLQYIRSSYTNQMYERGTGVTLFGFPGGSNANFRFAPGASGIPGKAAGTPDFTFGDDAFMDHGTFVQTGGWWGGQDDANMARNAAGQPMIHSCYGWGGQSASYCPAGYDVHGDAINTNSRYSENKDMTQEVGFNLKWDATSNLHFRFDAQYVDSTIKFFDDDISFTSYANVELSGLGTRPRVVSIQAPANIDLSPGGLSNPNNYAIGVLADNIQDSKGHELALRADGEWNVPGDSWIDTLKFGARFSDRDQRTQNSAYNWNNVANNWTNGCQYLYYNLDSKPGSCVNGGQTTNFNGYPSGFYSVEKFGNPFFGGGVGNAPFVPLDFMRNQGINLFSRDKIGVGTYQPICDRIGNLPGSCFRPDEIATISEETHAAYLMAKFGDNDQIHLGSVRIRGNIGVRFVETREKSAGYTLYSTQLASDPATSCPSTPLVPGGLTGNATLPVAIPGQAPQVPFSSICYLSPEDQKFPLGNAAGTLNSANVTHHNWLPSFNLRFDFSPKWLLRFAASKAMSRPDIGLLKNYLRVSQNLASTSNPDDSRWVKDAQGKIIGQKPEYLADATNPSLKPTTAWQFDLSLEHYFGNSGMFSLAVFHKSFQNYIQYGFFNTDLTNQGVTRTVRVHGPANGKGAKIDGIEVAYNRFFDFLPKPFDGLGIQTNYTYVKNTGVPNANLATQFPISGAGITPALDPGSLEGLSKHSFNIVGVYERQNFPVSLRLAYNWRSKYLVTVADCCVGLPVWQAASGYLDGSIRLNLNKQFEVSLEGSNLLNTQTVTLQQLADPSSPEKKMILMQNSWFRQDRRFTLGVRWKLGG